MPGRPAGHEGRIIRSSAEMLWRAEPRHRDEVFLASQIRVGDGAGDRQGEKDTRLPQFGFDDFEVELANAQPDHNLKSPFSYSSPEYRASPA